MNGEAEKKAEEKGLQESIDAMLDDIPGSGDEDEDRDSDGTGDMDAGAEEATSEEDAADDEEEEDAGEEESVGEEEESVGEEGDQEDAEEGAEEEEKQDEAEEDEEPAGEPDDEEDKDALIASLREQLARRAGEEEEEEVPTEEPEEFSILGDADLDDILDSPDAFNRVMGTAFENFGNVMMKKFLMSIPKVVMQQVRHQSVVQKAVNAFYEENDDLLPYRKLVGATVNEVVSENPDWKMDKVFEESAIRSRKALGLRKGAQKVVRKKKKPSFAKPKGKSDKSGVKKKPSKLQTDIDNLIDGD
jgi:hypothetical protein